jgi:hypothetical protein
LSPQQAGRRFGARSRRPTDRQTHDVRETTPCQPNPRARSSTPPATAPRTWTGGRTACAWTC